MSVMGVRDVIVPGTRVRPLAGPSANRLPGIHVRPEAERKDVDGRDWPGHDVSERAMPPLLHIRTQMWSVPKPYRSSVTLSRYFFLFIRV
jgi:hypothetical protein